MLSAVVGLWRLRLHLSITRITSSTVDRCVLCVQLKLLNTNRVLLLVVELVAQSILSYHLILSHYLLHLVIHLDIARIWILAVMSRVGVDNLRSLCFDIHIV